MNFDLSNQLLISQQIINHLLNQRMILQQNKVRFYAIDFAFAYIIIATPPLFTVMMSPRAQCVVRGDVIGVRRGPYHLTCHVAKSEVVYKLIIA